MLCQCYAMSSLHRQQGKPNWFCAFTDATGKRHFQSTGTPDRKKAEIICSTLGQAERKSKNSELTHQQVRTMLERAMATIMEGSPGVQPGHSIREFMTDWLKDIRGRISVSTYKSYTAITKRFLDHLAHKADNKISAVEITDIRGYRDSISGILSTGTINNHLKMLRLMFDAAKEQDVMDKNPARIVKNLSRTDKQERRPFTPSELGRLLTTLEGDWRTAVLVGYYTGLRIGDVTNLKWSNVDLDKAVYSLKTKKTGRMVIVPIAPPLLRLLKDLRSKSRGEFVCGSLAGVPVKMLSSQFNTILASAGLVERKNYRTYKADGQRRKYAGLSFHCLRHTLTSELKNTGATSAIAGDIVGHDSEAMSRNYTKIDLEIKRAALDKLPDLVGQNRLQK